MQDDKLVRINLMYLFPCPVKYEHFPVSFVGLNSPYLRNRPRIYVNASFCIVDFRK